MHLIPLTERIVKCSVENGLSARFWFDNWTSLGPLIKMLGHDGPRSMCIPVNAMMAEACDNQGWKLAAARSETAFTLHTHLTIISLPSSSNLEDSLC